MKKVRAKFLCTVVEDQPPFKQQVVSFSAVTTGSEENKSFAKQTPGGTLQMWISYETQASDAFEKGKEYYLDILPIPSNYKQKKEAEKEELEIRLEKLNAFNQSEKANEIAPEQKSILIIQAGAMYTYLECLKEALARF